MNNYIGIIFNPGVFYYNITMPDIEDTVGSWLGEKRFNKDIIYVSDGDLRLHISNKGQIKAFKNVSMDETTWSSINTLLTWALPKVAEIFSSQESNLLNKLDIIWGEQNNNNENYDKQLLGFFSDKASKGIKVQTTGLNSGAYCSEVSFGYVLN